MPIDLKALTRERAIFFDCGTGTTLQAQGLATGDRPEIWSVTRPETLVQFHRACLDAGADLLKINTFGANAAHYPPGGKYALQELISAAVANAKEAIRLCGREGSAWAAFDMGPTGRLLAPYGELAFEDAAAIFREAASLAAEAGADFILIETMSDTLEAKAAALGAKEGAPALPFAVTMTFEENGRLLTGGTAAAALATMEALGAAAFGVNCGAGPERALRILPELLRQSNIPVIVNPNAGLPQVENGRAVFNMTPQAFAEQGEKMFALGAALLGGCCGTTPAHIAALTARLRGKTPVLPHGQHRPILCSARKILLPDETPQMGTLDTTVVAETLRSGDWEELCDAAIDLECEGAELLVLPLPADADPSRAAEAVGQLQCMTQLPLCFGFSGGAAALEAALRHYNGVPLVRCEHKNDRQAVMALAEKYGAEVSE